MSEASPRFSPVLELRAAAQARRVALPSHREWQRGFRADPGIVGRTLAATALASLAAGWLPARRAAAVDPAQTLRGD
jgi:hypothetical protein